MLSLEDARQSIISNLQTIHELYYGSTLINYPNFNVVDVEKQVDPFVNVELEFDSERAAMGTRDLLLGGTLYVNFYFRDGRGLAGAYSYTDTLNEFIGMLLIDDVQYQAVRTFNISTFPGWSGVSNALKFVAGQGVGC